MRRREFISLLGGAAASWPLAARAQPSAMPVIGLLSGSSLVGRTHMLAAFLRGLRESGYVEGENVAIEYRWGQDQYDRLPDLAANLVGRRVAVIAAIDTAGAIAAKAATTTVPVVFASGGDPVREGLVASLSRPGGNVTGVSFLSSETGPKLLGLLLELLPRATRIAALVDPKWPITEAFVVDVRAAAAAIGKPIDVLHVSSGSDLDAVFASFAQKPVDALVVGGGALTNSRRVQIATLAAYHRVPAIYFAARVRRRRRIDELRGEHHRRAAPGRHLCRPDSQRPEARRSAGHAVGQVRVRDQPQHRQGIRA
jgi:putative tryptophan/tyrosine transport system substrate-binding protein